MKILSAKNGLTVLFLPTKSKLVSIRYYVNCGSIDELRPKDFGLCHALEHMLFAGTTNRTWDKVVRDWERIGAAFNAFTGHNKTAYHTIATNKYWKEAYEVLADVFYNPTFPEQRWEEVEKGAIISEIQEVEDDDRSFLVETVLQKALGRKNYHPIAGSQDNIRKARVAELKSFYDRYYCGENIVLVVNGDLSEEELLKTVNKYDRLKNKQPPKRHKGTYNFNYSPVVFRRMSEQTLIHVVKPVNFSNTLRSKFALGIGQQCLTRHLFKELREERGLCYDVNAEVLDEIPNHTFIMASVATDSDRHNKTEKVLKDAFTSFIKEGLTDEKIEAAKAAEKLILCLAAESAIGTGDKIWEAWEKQIYTDPFKSYSEILDNLNNGAVRKTMSQALTGDWKIGRMLTEE